MESGKPSNQSAQGVDIPPTTCNLVFHTHRRAGVRSAQRIGVRLCSRATDVCPAYLSNPIYKNINRAIIYAPGSSHAYIQQNHQDITTRISK
jgi:hypothetical protein